MRRLWRFLQRWLAQAARRFLGAPRGGVRQTQQVQRRRQIDVRRQPAKSIPTLRSLDAEVWKPVPLELREAIGAAVMRTVGATYLPDHLRRELWVRGPYDAVKRFLDNVGEDFGVLASSGRRRSYLQGVLGILRQVDESRADSKLDEMPLYTVVRCQDEALSQEAMEKLLVARRIEAALRALDSGTDPAGNASLDARAAAAIRIWSWSSVDDLHALLAELGLSVQPLEPNPPEWPIGASDNVPPSASTGGGS